MQILIELGKDKQQCGENAKSCFWGKVFELQVGLGLGSVLGLGLGVVSWQQVHTALTVAHSPRLHWASRWACRLASPPFVCRDQFAANEENEINRKRK